MAMRPCLTCGTPSPAGGGCPRHPRPGATARGYTSQWQRTSRAAIAAHPWCTHCGATHDLTTDHITPKRHGGTDHADNLQVLCRRCNSAKRDRTT